MKRLGPFIACATIALAFAIALCFVLSGCSPKRLDPPTLTYDTPILTELSAKAHAATANGKVYYVMDTHSMEPTLWGGDFIVVVPAPYHELKLGQIITYQADWQPAGAPPVTHRLVKQDGLGWVLSGDNNARSEPQWRVTSRNYIGLVAGIYRVKK